MLRSIVAIAALVLTTACHMDVLSTKPETGATVPAGPAPQPAPAPAPETPAATPPAETVPVTPTPVARPEPAPAPTPAPPPAPIVQPAPSPLPLPPSGIAINTGTDPVPFTDKLVRGLHNASTLTLNVGQTLTVVMNSNTSDGYDWVIQPLPAGLELYGDYYRATPPSPGQPNIGGSRYFLFRGTAAGTHPVQIHHQKGTDIRATKSFFVAVSPAP
jgi:predicted secreted protein